MLFNLAVKNIRNSLRDYSIYFFTLVIGVAIFYSFSAINGQAAMMELAGERGRLASVLGQIISGMSIFVAIVLGLLIVYASRFLMKRRSREFAIYMTLGMGRRHVSAILIMETILTGAVSLLIGLIVGMGLSQIMGVFVIKLFDTKMSIYSFHVSGEAVMKTILYFFVMYFIVMLFNGHVVSRMKLIDLLNSGKKTEQVKMKNPVLCIVVFIAASVMLAFAYYTAGWNTVALDMSKMTVCIVLGSVATFMVFWSVSGLLLRIVGSMKKTYFSGLNSFTFRQISSKINTVVFAMTIICLMLFFTICSLASAFSMRKGMSRTIERCPADFQLRQSEIMISAGEKAVFDDIVERYAVYGYDLPSRFDGYLHFHTYYDPGLELGEITKMSAGELLTTGRSNEIIKLSDYNALAELYGAQPLALNDDQYAVLCTYKQNMAVYNKCLARNTQAVVFGHPLEAAYPEVREGFVDIQGAATNTGIIVIPDTAADESYAADDYFIGNYRADSDEERAKIESECRNEYVEVTQRMSEDSDDGKMPEEYFLRLESKTEYVDNMVGMTALLTIVCLYLGLIFLISSGAILALRELSDSVDSIPRYDVLRKIGAEETMIEKSLLVQSAIFFLLPLLLAAVHSIFGMKMAMSIISFFGKEGMMTSIALTCAVILLLYGGYFIITYRSSRRIIGPGRDSHAEITRKDALKLAVSLTAVLILLAACVLLTGRQSESPYNTGTPWIDSDLEGVVTKKTSAEPKDDFALAVNRDAILNLKIPEGYTSAGTTVDISIQAAEDVKKMFEGERPESHDARLAYDLYQLITDWDSRNEAGVEPLKERTDRLEAVTSINDLNEYLTKNEDRLGLLWGSGAAVDLTDSSRYVLCVKTVGLTLGDSSEYRQLSRDGRKAQKAYRQFAAKMYTKLGYSEEEAAQKIDNCFRFEELLAEAIPSNEETGKPNYIEKINNHYTRAELEVKQGNLPILAELEKNQGYPEADDYRVEQPSYLEKLNELYTDNNLTMIKDYLMTKGITAAATRLDQECCKWSDEFLSAVSGTEVSTFDDSACAESVSGMLRWAAAKFYTETYLKEEDKIRVGELVDEIIKEYHEMLEETDFLSDATRAAAIEKLESMDRYILYPDDWEKYSYDGLDFPSKEEGGTYLEAVKAMDRFFLNQEIEKYSRPVDKKEWLQTPQTANCGYNAQTNNIYISGAFARPAVYSGDMSDEELYAKLGTVIGHEISHAFDSKGAQFDKDGNMVNWWTEEDKETFREKNKKMASYYNSIHPWEGLYLKGAAMTGEACADMAGMKCILRIAAEKQGFDYDRFFRAYAGLWLTKDTVQQARDRASYDPHPMPYLRINVTLQQFDEFLNCYGITEGDGMYLAPENRITIW